MALFTCCVRVGRVTVVPVPAKVALLLDIVDGRGRQAGLLALLIPNENALANPKWRSPSKAQLVWLSELVLWRRLWVSGSGGLRGARAGVFRLGLSVWLKGACCCGQRARATTPP